MFRNIFFKAFKIFWVIIKLFVTIKEFDATNRQAEMETRGKDETGERLKVCCLSDYFNLVADTLNTEQVEFIRSDVGDGWCWFLEANANSLQKLQACFLLNFFLGRMEHDLDKHLVPRCWRCYFVLHLVWRTFYRVKYLFFYPTFWYHFDISSHQIRHWNLLVVKKTTIAVLISLEHWQCNTHNCSHCEVCGTVGVCVWVEKKTFSPPLCQRQAR